MQSLIVVNQLAAVLEDIIARHAKSEGLFVADVMAMSQMARNPGLSCAEIAWQLARARANVQRTLMGLMARELVLRDRDPGNPRSVGWMLTARGEASYEIVRNRIKLEEEDLKRTLPALEHYLDGFREVIRALHDRHKEPVSMLDYKRPPPTHADRPPREYDDGQN